MYRSLNIDGKNNYKNQKNTLHHKENSTFISSSLYGQNLTTSASFLTRQRSISEIKKENLLSKQTNLDYIETMVRSGNFFRYDLEKPHIGTHRSHLEMLENTTRSSKSDMNNEINKLINFQKHCITFRDEMKNDYKNLRSELQNETNFLQLKLTTNINRQKIENQKIIYNLKELKGDLTNNINFLLELKQRVDALKLRIDGKPLYNNDGIPVLDTKI